MDHIFQRAILQRSILMHYVPMWLRQIWNYHSNSPSCDSASFSRQTADAFSIRNENLLSYMFRFEEIKQSSSEQRRSPLQGIFLVRWRDEATTLGQSSSNRLKPVVLVSVFINPFCSFGR